MRVHRAAIVTPNSESPIRPKSNTSKSAILNSIEIKNQNNISWVDLILDLSLPSAIFLRSIAGTNNLGIRANPLYLLFAPGSSSPLPAHRRCSTLLLLQGPQHYRTIASSDNDDVATPQDHSPMLRVTGTPQFQGREKYSWCH